MAGGVHLDFLLCWDGGTSKTKVWDVVTKDHSLCLGIVRWHSPWRRYCFFPLNGTLYDALCLHAIATFCSQQTDERKKTWKSSKKAKAK